MKILLIYYRTSVIVKFHTATLSYNLVHTIVLYISGSLSPVHTIVYQWWLSSVHTIVQPHSYYRTSLIVKFRAQYRTSVTVNSHTSVIVKSRTFTLSYISDSYRKPLQHYCTLATVNYRTSVAI